MLLMLPALGEVKPPEGDDEQKAAFLGLRERPNAKRDGRQSDHNVSYLTVFLTTCTVS